MRILFATNTIYPPQRAGGTESSVHDLCMELQKRGVSVAVLAALRAGDAVYLKNRLMYKLHNSISFPVDMGMGYPVFRGWAPAEGAEEVVQRFKPTIVITQKNYLNMAAAFLAAGVPTILYLRNAEFDYMREMDRSYDDVNYLANSQFIADLFRGEFGIRSTVIPPLVRSEVYRTISNRTKVIFVNPHPSKGVDIALKLAKCRPDIEFEFFESWPIGDKVREESRARGRNIGNIRWRKRVLDMRKVYRKAKIVLVPSRCDEAWARVVSEAHVSGIPVLASNRGGLPESVGPGGILVDPESEISEWEKALSRLWDDQAEYEIFSKAALEYSKRAEFQPSYLVSKLLDFISAHLSKLGQNSRTDVWSR